MLFDGLQIKNFTKLVLEFGDRINKVTKVSYLSACFSLFQASPDNSRNASPRYHDVSMEDVSYLLT